ncbi:MAG: hypothetical protein WAW57_15255 [Lutibacter sp.]
MNELIQYQKPELIILAEKKKLRDYEIETRKAYAVKLIAKLLNLLGVNDGKTEQHNALAIHVCDYYGHVSFEQIDKAFGLFVLGTFKTKPFQQLNAVVFGQVMADYFDYEKDQTKIYKMKIQEMKETAPTMDKEESDKFMEIAIKEAIEIYKKTGDIELPVSKYDWLDSKGLMQGELSLEKWNNIKRDKMESVRTRLIEVYGKAKAISFEDKIEIKNTLKNLQQKNCGMAVAQAKLELLTDYFNKNL